MLVSSMTQLKFVAKVFTRKIQIKIELLVNMYVINSWEQSNAKPSRRKK